MQPMPPKLYSSAVVKLPETSHYAMEAITGRKLSHPALPSLKTQNIDE